MRFVILLLLTPVLTHGQSFRIGQFDEIKVFDGIRVTVIPSDVDSLVVEGKNKDYVSYSNKNGRLVIRMNVKKRFSGFNTTVALFCSSPLEKIDANEGAFVSCQDVLFQQSIRLNAQEGSEIEAILDVQKVYTKTVSGGVVNLKGAAVIQEHRVSAGGVVNASTLESEQVEVRVQAGGNAAVRATELAEATVLFGGSVNLYGDPKKLIKKVSIGGNISLAPPPADQENTNE